MRISKLLIVVFYTIQLFGQTKTIVINNTDSLSVNNFDEINTIIDSLINNSNDIGEYFVLKKVRSDRLVLYDKKSENIKLDTIIFKNNDVRNSIQEQIFSSLQNTKPIINTNSQFRKVLRSVPFLNNASTISYGLYNDDNIGAVVDIDANFNNYFSGLVGASRSDEQKWEVNGQIEIHLENQWKTAAIIDLQWKRLTGESQLLRLKYEEPHPFGLPIGISLAYNQDLRQGNYVSSESAIGIIKSIPGIGKIGFGGKNTKLNTTSKGGSLGLSDLKAQYIYIDGIIDYRNDYWLPTEGFLINLHSDLGNRTVADSSSISVSTVNRFEKYFSLFKKTNLALKVLASGNWIKTGTQHIGELVRYGGVNNLRGYVEDNFSSNWVVIPSFELNFNFSKVQQLTLFSDFALQDTYDPIPFGYGLGLTQVSDNSVLRLYYGLGRGDSIKNGKIHLQFLTRL